MAYLLRIFGAIILIYGAVATQKDDFDPTGNKEYLEFTDRILSANMRIQSDPVLKAQLDKKMAEIQAIEEDYVPVEYHCDPNKISKSQSVPTSVHQLRPNDIKVIAAFGDSITACNGCGARNLVELAIEKRGESWAIGSDRSMDEGYVTIPNLIEKFGGQPAGYSTCWSLQYSDYAWFNVARPGARNVHMPAQAVRMVELMQEDTRHVDFENDWKLITLFIGGNDLCGWCRRPDSNSPENYRANIEEAVDTIMNNVPRALVQIVDMFDVSPLANLTRSTICSIMQMGWCECALNATMIPPLRQVVKDYHAQMEDLVAQPKYHDKQDFTVVLQPHMRNLKPIYLEEKGEWDSRYLGVDCFHPNRIGHRGLAYMLWNSMLWPVGQKPTDQDMTIEKFEICCPSEEFPYIFTQENSQGVPSNPWTPGQMCWNPSGSQSANVQHTYWNPPKKSKGTKARPPRLRSTAARMLRNRNHGTN